MYGGVEAQQAEEREPQAHAGIGRGQQMHEHRGDEQAARAGQHHAAMSVREVLPRIFLPRRR